MPINIWYLVPLCSGYMGRTCFPNLKLNMAMKHAIANTSRGDIIHFGVKRFKIHLAPFCDLFVLVTVWRHPWWQSSYQPESWRREHAMEQRPLSGHTGHAAWARNKALLFKALTQAAICYSNKTKPILIDKIWTRDLEYYSGTTFTGNLTLSAQFRQRRFVVYEQIKEAKSNFFSLFPQREHLCEFTNLTPKRQYGLSKFIS